MDQDIREKFEVQDKKLDAIWHSVEKIRKQLFWKSVFGTILFLLPLIGIVALIPWLMNTLSSIYKFR
jgi:TRAP-type mannitol/chloroaromatic compound transport system permease small subunit